MTGKVLLPNDIPEAGKQILRDAGLKIIMGTGRDLERMKHEGSEVDAVLVGTQTFNANIMDAMPNLKVISRNGVGYDAVDIAAATKRGIYVTFTPEALSDSVAETTIAEILALSKNIVQDVEALARGDWNYKRSHLGHDLSGKTLGILGFGRIGQALARKMRAFDMTIIAYDPFAKFSELAEIVSRDELFTRADIISIHLPAIKATEKSVGKTEFKLMKKSAFLVNLARGSIVDEEALIEALETKEIAAAALDVFEKEPLPLDSPLLSLDNVLLTPHIASNTAETREKMAVHAARGIVEVLNGQKPTWAVNKL